MQQEYKIPLKNIKKEIVDYALCDKDDYENLLKFKWSKSCYGYAASNKKGKCLQTMHHIVNEREIPKGHVIDHINHNRLDNRKSNLRVVSRSLNNHNRTTKGEYIGVSACTNSTNPYVACFRSNHLGCFDDPLEAASRYDICAYLYYGAGANTNGTISYENALKYTLDDMYRKKKVRKLPNNIYVNTSPFTGEVTYRIDMRSGEDRYRKQGFLNVEEAVRCLKQFQALIDAKRKKVADAKNSRPIERNEDGIAIIKIKEHEILVDDERWYELTEIAWSVTEKLYVIGQTSGKHWTMHRYVFGADDSVEVVDHKNRNKLDNRLCNLRAATYAENNQNREMSSENATSTYKGVTLDQREKLGDLQWTARISFEYKTVYIGIYATQEEAAVAYNIKARELYGDHAYVNQVDNEADLLPSVMQSLTFFKKKSGCSCTYRGVCMKQGLYCVRVKQNGKENFIGNFDDPIDAAIAYNIAYKYYNPDHPKIPNNVPLTQAVYKQKEDAIRLRLIKQGKIKIT